MRLDGRKDIKSVKSGWSVLHAEIKASYPLYGGNSKGHRANTHIYLAVGCTLTPLQMFFESTQSMQCH